MEPSNLSWMKPFTATVNITTYGCYHASDMGEVRDISHRNFWGHQRAVDSGVKFEELLLRVMLSKKERSPKMPNPYLVCSGAYTLLTICNGLEYSAWSRRMCVTLHGILGTQILIRVDILRGSCYFTSLGSLKKETDKIKWLSKLHACDDTSLCDCWQLKGEMRA